MNPLIILPIILLSACSIVKPNIVNPNVVKAHEEIMLDCDEYIKPSSSSISDLLKVILENKKIYVICSNQNKAKKDFINRQ